jgi:hypothetical protein
MAKMLRAELRDLQEVELEGLPLAEPGFLAELGETVDASRKASARAVVSQAETVSSS